MADFLKHPAHPDQGPAANEKPLHEELAREYAELVKLPADPAAERALKQIDKLFDELLKIAK